MYAGYDVHKKLHILNSLPESWHSEYGNVLGGFNNLPIDEINKHGVYPIEDQEIDKIREKKGLLYFDKNKKVFKYEIQILKNIGTKEQNREVKKVDLLNNLHKKLQPTNSYIIDFVEEEIQIPNNIKEKRRYFRNIYNKKLEQLNQIDSIENIILFNTEI